MWAAKKLTQKHGLTMRTWICLTTLSIGGAAIPLAADELPGTSSPIVFRRHILNSESEFSACAVLDVNHDAQPDIFCGGFWYEGPDWIPHRTRDVPMIRGRYDDYSNLPLDVDGDGWTDIVSVNYRSRSLYWIQNPGRSLDEWKTHLIDSPGESETGRLCDIDGDGKLDVLPNGTRFAAWFEIDRKAKNATPTRPVWVRHDLPEEVVGHGLGAGDLDGDGRIDLVAPNGWLQGPDDPRQERWQWHAEYELHRDCSIPILVHDVDGDGDQDVIWGRGHNVGLYWLEQRQIDGQRDWRQHAIDTSWSSAHSLLLADLNGDGTCELVAGKRYLGHDGKDPGEWEPLQVVAYHYVPANRVWETWPISWDGPCGFDLDPACADVDLDGDIDLVAPTRAGLSLLENLGIARMCRASPRNDSRRHRFTPPPIRCCCCEGILPKCDPSRRVWIGVIAAVRY